MISKSKMRNAAKRIRAQAHLSDPDAGSEIIAHFPVSKSAGQILGGYWPFKNELDVLPLLHHLQADPCQTALPCVDNKNAPLIFRQYERGAELVPGAFGIMEPPRDVPQLIPDLILLPLLAFTARGDRLGYGGGFYDRTLAALKAKKQVFACGVAYAAQEVDALPTEPHDMRLDAILTEKYYREF